MMSHIKDIAGMCMQDVASGRDTDFFGSFVFGGFSYAQELFWKAIAAKDTKDAQALLGKLFQHDTIHIWLDWTADSVIAFVRFGDTLLSEEDTTRWADGLFLWLVAGSRDSGAQMDVRVVIVKDVTTRETFCDTDVLAAARHIDMVED